MEQLTKKEFFAQYAGKKEKTNITSAAGLAYVCAAISLGLGIYLHNYAVLIDVALIVGLALGIQRAQSRVCAVVLLVYGCINTVLMTLDTGRLSGWWLIFVGIWAVRGIFRLHRDYHSFLQDGTLPQHTEPERLAGAKITAGQTFATVLPFVGMFLGLLLLLLSIRPEFLELLVGDAPSPEALLRGYRSWYIAIMAAFSAAVLLAAAGVAISVWKGLRTISSVRIMILSLAFPIFIGGFMLVSERVPALFAQASEDIAQIESGQLREVTVWLSPKSRAARLPGPYAEGQPEPVTRYGGISQETNGVWVEFYVPDCLHFSLDQNALYQEEESILWNEEHARQYRICYTENFCLAVSVEPVGGLAPEGSPQEWETQVYEDAYLSYEIPASWQIHENSSEELRLTLFTEQEPAVQRPSNVSVQILSLQSRSRDFDYADPEIQALFHQFLIRPDSGLAAEAQEGAYAAEQIGDTWVYSIRFVREADDGTLVQQTGYFPMGLDYTLAVWATDYRDGCTPAVEDIAVHICETLQIIGV